MVAKPPAAGDAGDEGDGAAADGGKLSLSEVEAAVKNGELDTAKELFLNGRGAGSVTSLKKLVSLRKLELRENQLSELGFLKSCTELCWLALSRNRLNRLSHLDALTNLAVIDVSDNRIEALSGLEGLSSLKALIAPRNRIRNLDGLSAKQNPALETLVLSHNFLKECKLRGFKALRKFSAGHNHMSSFPRLEKLPELSELRLNGMRLDAVDESIVSLESLSILDLGNNKITKAAALEPLARLPALKSLTLLGNPCAPVGADEPEGGLADFLASVPKLEILNNRRRDGQASGKKKRKKDGEAGAAAEQEAGGGEEAWRGRKHGDSWWSSAEATDPGADEGKGKGKGKGKSKDKGKGKGKSKGKDQAEGGGKGKGKDHEGKGKGKGKDKGKDKGKGKGKGKDKGKGKTREREPWGDDRRHGDGTEDAPIAATSAVERKRKAHGGAEAEKVKSRRTGPDSQKAVAQDSAQAESAGMKRKKVKRVAQDATAPATESKVKTKKKKKVAQQSGSDAREGLPAPAAAAGAVAKKKKKKVKGQ